MLNQITAIVAIVGAAIFAVGLANHWAKNPVAQKLLLFALALTVGSTMELLGFVESSKVVVRLIGGGLLFWLGVSMIVVRVRKD